MNLCLDHVVIAVADLEAALADYRALGFTVHMGGHHPLRTSHNALVVFADGTYLELITWKEPGPSDRWYREHARHGDGFMDFALLPEDTAAAVASARARGLDLDGPRDAGRFRPDGVQLRWQTARQASFDLPFLCGDVTPRELRVPTGDVRHHANGVIGIAALTVAVSDLDASRARYRALLADDGFDGQRVGAAFVVPRTGLRTALVRLGRCVIVLAQPLSGDGHPASLASQTVRDRLKQRGEGPCAMALATAAGPVGTSLDPSLTHGAALEI